MCVQCISLSGVALLSMGVALLSINHTHFSHRYEEAVPHVNMLYLGGTIGINRVALMLGAMKPVQDANVWKRLSLDMVNRKVYEVNKRILTYNHN